MRLNSCFLFVPNIAFLPLFLYMLRQFDMCSTSTINILVNRISKFSWQSHKRRVCQLIIDFAIPHSRCPTLFSNIFLWLEASCEQPRELHEIFRQDDWIQLRSTGIE